MHLLKKLSTLLLLAPAFSLISCVSNEVSDPSDDPYLQRHLIGEPEYVSESGFSFWDADKVGELTVTIDLSEQKASFYRDGVFAGQSRVATGRRGHRTPTGSFTILAKEVDKRSNLYGQIFDADGTLLVDDADTRRDSVPPGGRYVGAAMPYWMRLTDSGIGMHVGPIPNPGQPASHGCIRMPRTMAQILFQNAPIGTPVTIVR